MIMRDMVVCADGTTLSVQASTIHYCSPRNDQGPWDSVEVGFVTNPKGGQYTPKGWKQYGGPDVFGRVPIATVNKFIRARGGETSNVMETFRGEV